MSDKKNKKDAIRVKDVNVYYGENRAIKDVSMDIKEKSVTAFIGPSGCGKSTLLRCLNRMNDEIVGCRTEGAIFVHPGRTFFAHYQPAKGRRNYGDGARHVHEIARPHGTGILVSL